MAFASADSTTFSSSNAFDVVVANGVGVHAGADIVIAAQKSTYVSAASNVSVAAGSNVAIAAALDMALTATTLEAATSSTMAFASADSTTFSSSNAFSVTAANGVGVYAGADIVIAAQKSTYVSAASNVSVAAGSNVAIAAAYAIDIKAAQDITAEAKTLLATLETSATFVAPAFVLDSTVAQFSTSNLTMTASNTTLMTSGMSNVLVAANDSVTATNGIDLHSLVDTHVLADRDLYLTASNNASVFASVNMTLEAPQFVTKGTTLSETFLGSMTSMAHDQYHTASNNFAVTCIHNSVTANTVDVQGSDYVKLFADDTSYVRIIPGEVTTHIMSQDIMIISESNVLINGQLQVNGDIISITTYQETLEVFDKTVTLAPGGTQDNIGVFMDSPLVNSGCGIVIGGLPSTDGMALLDDAASKLMYEKSFKWGCTRYDAMTHLTDAGTTNADSINSFQNESYWELKGGDFRMTLMKSDTDWVTFAWRINAYHEMELIKQYKVDNTWNTKVVSKFGRIMNDAGSIVL